MVSLKEVFRTELREYRAFRSLSLLVKAGKIQEKDKTKAIELYERVIEMGERVADAQLSLAYLIEKDDPERADALYRAAVDSGEEDAPLLYGLFLADSGHLERAKEMFELSVSRGDAEDAAACLGAALMGEGGDRGRARELLQSAREHHSVFAPLLLAQLAAEDGDRDAAVDYCEEAIKAGDPKAKAVLGLLVADEGDLERAKALLEEAIKDGDLERAPVFLADLLREEDAARAIELYKVAIANGGERLAASRLASMF